MLVTLIPNMTGLIGFIQKLVNRPIYDIHVPLQTDELVEAHRQAGLQVVRCEYFVPLSFTVSNLNGLDPDSIITRIKSQFLYVLSLISRVIWITDEYIVPFSVNRFSGSYVMSVAQKQ